MAQDEAKIKAIAKRLRIEVCERFVDLFCDGELITRIMRNLGHYTFTEHFNIIIDNTIIEVYVDTEFDYCMIHDKYNFNDHEPYYPGEEPRDQSIEVSYHNKLIPS